MALTSQEWAAKYSEACARGVNQSTLAAIANAYRTAAAAEGAAAVALSCSTAPARSSSLGRVSIVDSRTIRPANLAVIASPYEPPVFRPLTVGQPLTVIAVRDQPARRDFLAPLLDPPPVIDEWLLIGRLPRPAQIEAIRAISSSVNQFPVPVQQTWVRLPNGAQGILDWKDLEISARV